MVNKILFTVLTFIIVFAAYSAISKGKPPSSMVKKNDSPAISTLPDSPSISPNNIPLKENIYENLDTPWAVVFLPDGGMLVTERKGTVRLNGQIIATLKNVREIGEGGLMGIAVHPDFDSNHYVYLYYTYSAAGNNTSNRVVRMTLKNNVLGEEKIIVDSIPGASNHNGGRIKFGPDKYLYITTGDAQDPSRAQDRNSLSGKILRVTDEGKKAPGNPFDNLVYSYGHRNPQGLAWDANGQLYATEHGRSGIQSGLDELNRIDAGKNYGWPDIEGDETRAGMERSVIHSGSATTWAPAGLAFYNGSLFYGGLRGASLYKVNIVNGQPQLKEYFKGEFGRIREVIMGPDQMLYISTSNFDGRGIPSAGDDKIIRINPKKL